MPFPVDDILLGADAFGRLHRVDMLIGHTGEEPGFSRDYAVKTTLWQAAGNPGSYSFRIYDSKLPGSKGGILLTVPYLEASGGINPSSAAWAPERFPFLERELAKAGRCLVAGCPGPYRNPTMHAGQISFTGRTDALQASAPANYVPDAERLIDWYESHPLRGPAPLVLVMHGQWQSNRSDWGAWMHAQLTEEPEMKPRGPVVTQTWDTKVTDFDTFTRPDGTTGRFYSTERVKSILEVTLPNGRDGRILDYGSDHEALAIDRFHGLENPGPRVVGSDEGVSLDEVIQGRIDLKRQVIEAYTAGGTERAQAVST